MSYTKMKTLCVAAALAVIFSCHKEKAEPIIEAAEELTPELTDFLDNLPVIAVPNRDLMLPTGESVQEALEELDPNFLKEYPSTLRVQVENLPPRGQMRAFLSQVFGVANNLSDPILNKKDKGSGTDEPAQTKLAYSYGSYDLERHSPPFGKCNGEKVIGLDCGGFMSMIFKAAGVQLPKTAGLQRDVEKLNKAFAASPYKDIYAEDITADINNNIKLARPGDIVYFLRGTNTNHIGFVLTTRSNSIGMFHSSGVDCTGGCDGDFKGCRQNGQPLTGDACVKCQTEQNRNSVGRGPRSTEIPSIVPRYFGDGRFGIVRLSVLTDIAFINAEKVWPQSVVEVRKGDELTVSSEGEWSHGIEGPNYVYYGGNGYTRVGSAAAILPGAKIGALIARIQDGVPFLIGAGTTFTANASGILQFMMNDEGGTQIGNRGALKVVVKRKKK